MADKKTHLYVRNKETDKLRRFSVAQWNAMDDADRSKWKKERGKPQEVKDMEARKAAEEKIKAEAAAEASGNTAPPAEDPKPEETDEPKGDEEPKEEFKISKGNYGYDEAIVMIKEMDDIEKIKKFIKGDTRSTVKAAAETRIEELSK